MAAVRTSGHSTGNNEALQIRSTRPLA